MINFLSKSQSFFTIVILSGHPERSEGSLPFEEGQCDSKYRNYKGEVSIIPHYARDKDSSLRSE